MTERDAGMTTTARTFKDRFRRATKGERKEFGATLWQQLPLIAVLVVLWMLLWGEVTPLSVLSGIVVALVVMRVFYLPPVELSGRFNVWWFLVFLAHFASDVFTASFQIAFRAFMPKPVTGNAIVAVDLVTRSDFIMTLTAITISLIPGSFVVEVDREHSILYLHAFNVPTRDQRDALSRKVLSVERQLVRALGTREDIRRARA